MLILSARQSIRAIEATVTKTHINNELTSNSRAFSSQSSLLSNLQVGDRILLRWKAGRNFKTKVTKPLREDGETIVDNNVIQHKDLLGKPSNTRVTSVSKDGLRKLHVTARYPTLDEFTSLSPRRVAPIYAMYASTIVSLLDIHADPPSPENDPTNSENVGQPSLQILEAGTGQGSLTLHLSRCIAPSNPPVTAAIKLAPSLTRIYRAGEESDDDITSTDTYSDALKQWRSQRRAVLHTIDIDPLNRKHADQLIRSYRNGTYWPHIDFHVADVKDWISERLSQNGSTAFLDIAILDMPGVESYISSAIPAIKEDGLLLVFVPQITQIATCVQEIVTKNLGLKLEKVVELGEGVSTGRMWDVRMATVRNAKLPKGAVKKDAEDGGVRVEDRGSDVVTPSVGTIPPMVCRPIVGEMTRGGGFVALWKKISPHEMGE